ncbi:hypothetical protein SAMN04489727_2226 [Amycolatopsis tolypomycina]|uniref:Uncharacterized protein n=2 Tax=Amycolatopsis tolypomycina TaxID=208445 RepID=A0A1H4P1G1_9PSEU|nr:hypothetical protein SAMN04489727_2226 [Amycolatopsis tolypomycina]
MVDRIQAAAEKYAPAGGEMLSPLEVTTAQTPTSCEEAAALALLTAAQRATDAKTAWHWYHVYGALVKSAAMGGFVDADGTYLLEAGESMSVTELANIRARF